MVNCARSLILFIAFHNEVNHIGKSCLSTDCVRQGVLQATLCVLVTRVQSSPVFVDLKSQYPANPIEDPNTWAWGQHPDNGLGYKAKDNLEVEVCLANPSFINTAKCNLPLSVCLENPQYLSSLGCSGNDLPPLPLDTCLAFPELLTFPACSGHSLPREVCMANPSLLPSPSCQGRTEMLIIQQTQPS